MCFNWNAHEATAETTNDKKMALFTDLRYFLPLVEGSVRILVLSKARNKPAARSSYHHLCSYARATTFVLRMRSSCLSSGCC